MQTKDFEKIFYKGGEHTARIFAQSLTINQLPREMRQAALRGAIHFDVRACQLAIAASIWHLPKKVYKFTYHYVLVGRLHRQLLQKLTSPNR